MMLFGSQAWLHVEALSVKKKKKKNRRKIISASQQSQPTTTEKLTPPPISPPSLLRLIRSHPWWTVASSFVAFVGIVLGAISSLSSLLGGPPWPVDPEINFRETNDGSSLILPFDIVNKSGFRMPSVSFRCGVQFLRAVDSLGNEIGTGDVAFLNGTKSVSKTATFDCNAADLLRIKLDGSLAFRNSATKLQSGSRIVYRAPWRIIKMCVWVGGNYNFMGLIPVEFTSHMFQWPTKAGSHQWREGPFIGDRPVEEVEEEKRLGLVPGIMACPDDRLFPYALVEGTGMAALVFDPQSLGDVGPPPWP